MIESWYRDFVLGLRGLRKRPIFCLTAILTLALGIGANTAIFTLLYGLLLRSLPVAQPWRLVRINLAGPIPGHGTQEFGLSWLMPRAASPPAAVLHGHLRLDAIHSCLRA